MAGASRLAASSGSSRSISSVDPETSANSTVICLSSPSLAGGLLVAVFVASAVPHCPQNRAAGGLLEWQEGQACPSAVPQSMQKRASGALFVSQFEQRIDSLQLVETTGHQINPG